MNSAKEVLKRMIVDKKYIQIVDTKEYKSIYKGKDFEKAWVCAAPENEFFIEVYETTKKYLGYLFIKNVVGDGENIYDFHGDYVVTVVDRFYHFEDSLIDKAY